MYFLQPGIIERHTNATIITKGKIDFFVLILIFLFLFLIFYQGLITSTSAKDAYLPAHKSAVLAMVNLKYLQLITEGNSNN